MTEFARLNRDEALNYFVVLEPFIERALSRSDNEYGIQDILNGLQTERMQSWIAVSDNNITAVAITEIILYPNYSDLLIRCIAGADKDKWMTPEWQEQTFEKFAKEAGCKNLIMFGRKGWSRVLDKLGWRESYLVMKKEI